MRTRYDKNDVKIQAKGYWGSILESVAGLTPDELNGKHQPCPKCGGRDRWRFSNFKQNGGAVCSTCGKFGDGLAVIQWYCGVDFQEAVNMVGDFLGMEKRSTGSASTSSPKTARRTASTPKDDKPKLRKDKPTAGKTHRFKIDAWSEVRAKMFCERKGFTVEALKLLGAVFGEYGIRNERVIGIPVRGQGNAVIGYTLFPLTGGAFDVRKGQEGDPPKTITIKYDNPDDVPKEDDEKQTDTIGA